jgi:dienelactone hydrolase
MPGKTRYFIAIILTMLFLLSTYVAFQQTTDFGRLRVETIKFSDKDHVVSGRLYVPSSAHPDNPRPLVVLAHGISCANEFMEGIALELARKGTVAFSIDLLGHGDSDGKIGGGDSSLGMVSAVEYATSLPFVDDGLIGVVGHSLGAGAARRTALVQPIIATAFIGGGVGGMAESEQYGSLSPTFPKNLLISIGQHDVLFDIEVLREDLKLVFDTPQSVIIDKLYGEFEKGNARKLVVSSTTHLMEPYDPLIVEKTVAWMQEAFDSPLEKEASQNDGIYGYREIFLLLSLFGLLSLTIILTTFIYQRMLFKEASHVREGEGLLEGWKIAVILGTIEIGLFLPFMVLGILIPFPPQLFGSSLAWWLLSSGLIGLILLHYFWKRHGMSFSIKSLLTESFEFLDLAVAVGLILILYLTSIALESSLEVNLRIFVPLLNSIGNLERVLAFPNYLPFFGFYFLVEGRYFYHERKTRESTLMDFFRVLGLKLVPFIAILLVQYLPMYWFNVRVFPGFLGFFIEFLWGITPIFVVSTSMSWWFHRVTGRIGLGVFFNTLLLSWISASLFPFGALM